jgi:hypothetical protein
MARRWSGAGYLFELFVVFLGVTSAFMLDRWGTKLREHRRERTYLASLYQDCQADSTHLEDVLAFYEEKLQALRRLERLLAAGDSLEVAEGLVPGVFFTHVFFKPGNDTWESLKAGGGLESVGSTELKVSLSRLEKRYYGLAKHEEFIGDFLRRHVIPYALEALDLAQMTFLDRREMTRQGFRNLLTAYRFVIEDYVRALRGTRPFCRAAGERLRRELRD